MTPEENYVRLIDAGDALPEGDLRRLVYARKINAARLKLTASKRQRVHKVSLKTVNAGLRCSTALSHKINRNRLPQNPPPQMHLIDYDRRRMIEGQLTKLMIENKLRRYSFIVDREIKVDESLRRDRGEETPTDWCMAMIDNRNRALRRLHAVVA